MTSSKTEVTMVKYIGYTKIDLKFEVDNDMNVVDLMEVLKRDYPGYSIASISKTEDRHHSTARCRTYSFVVISDGKRLLSEEKNNLLHLIGGGSEGGETTRKTMYREFNEEIQIFDKERWSPDFTFLDSRIAYHRGVRYLENFYILEVTNTEFDAITSREGRLLQSIPADMDYLNSLNIGVECDDAFYYGMMRAIQHLE